MTQQSEPSEAADVTTPLLKAIHSLDSLITVAVHEDFKLDYIRSDITGEHAIYGAIKRAVENFPGGVSAVAKSLELKPETLLKRIEALRIGGSRGLNANEMQKIVMLTGDRTPYLAMIQGLGVAAFEKPTFDVDPAALPILRIQLRQLHAVLLYLETLQEMISTDQEEEEMLRIAEKIARAADYQGLLIESAEEKDT